jgi:hypothetical protein
MYTDTGEGQTWTHIMCRLGKRYQQKDIKSGTRRIGEEKHPNMEATTKSNTMNTNHTLTNNCNPQSTYLNLEKVLTLSNFIAAE